MLEYCCPVWRNALPLYLAERLERVQKRAFRIILPEYTYSDALIFLKCPRLVERREKLCLKTLENIPERSPLFNHIPAPRVTCYDYNLRKPNALTTIKCRTERYRRSFFTSTVTLLLRLPVGRGRVINSPRFCFFSLSKVGAPLMGDTAVHSLSHDFKLNF